jgi:glycosyltransferase involved in cell wall biosynthesis
MYCGGQGIYASYLAREWQEQGHEVHVFAGPPLPELEAGIPLHEIPNDNVFGQEHPDFFDRDRPFSLLKPLSLWELGVSRLGVFPEMQTFGIRLLRRWKRIQERHRFDVVFDNQSLSWGLLGIRATGVPVISVIHHPLHIDREALDRIVTVSEASRVEIERYFGIPQKNIPVVYNGTDAELFRPVDGARKEADLLFVGRTDDRKKGIGTLLEALTLLPKHVKLKIVDGRITPKGLAARQIQRLGLGDRIVIENRRMLSVRELARQYSTGRVAIVPSFFEGFGFPASEAMACGLPVIANAAGALSEVVGTDGEAGYLVPPRDPRSIAEAVEFVLGEPGRAERMGRAARARIQKSFRWSDAAAQLAEIFEETRRAAHGRPRAA